MDLFLALLSGALLGLSVPKFGHPAFGWIALAPLFVALAARRDISDGRGFLLGFLTGLVSFAITLYWFVETMTTFGGLSTAMALVAAAAGISYLAIYPALFGFVQARLVRSFGVMALLIAPFVWVATEMARTYVYDGFPWELLGYSQTTALPVAQLASVTGVYGLSLLVAFVSAAAAFGALDRSARRWRVAATVGAVLVAVTGWGAVRLHRHVLTTAGVPIRVAVLQGNIAQDEKNAAYGGNRPIADAVVDRYVEMTREAIGRGAQFVLWPESATPAPYEQDAVRGELIRRLVREGHITLLMGSDQIEPVLAVAAGKPPSARYYNAAYLIQPDGTTAAVYRKIHLVPFGEYVPLKSLLFFVGPLVDAVSDFSPGTDPIVLPVAGHLASTAICYEVIYSGLMRVFVQRGSELLTTITNDAWYGRSSAAYQHWEQASLRAVEEGRYLARAANTGISGFVDPYGRVMQQSNMFQSAVLAEDLRFIKDKTIYGRIGNVAGWTSVALTLVALVSTRKRTVTPVS